MGTRRSRTCWDLTSVWFFGWLLSDLGPPSLFHTMPRYSAELFPCQMEPFQLPPVPCHMALTCPETHKQSVPVASPPVCLPGGRHSPRSRRCTSPSTGPSSLVHPHQPCTLSSAAPAPPCQRQRSSWTTGQQADKAESPHLGADAIVGRRTLSSQAAWREEAGGDLASLPGQAPCREYSAFKSQQKSAVLLAELKSLGLGLDSAPAT